MEKCIQCNGHHELALAYPLKFSPPPCSHGFGDSIIGRATHSRCECIGLILSHWQALIPFLRNKCWNSHASATVYELILDELGLMECIQLSATGSSITTRTQVCSTEKRIFYCLSMQIREKISSHKLHQMHTRTSHCWIAGACMVCMYVIYIESVLWIFKWLAGWVQFRQFRC